MVLALSKGPELPNIILKKKKKKKKKKNKLGADR